MADHSHTWLEPDSPLGIWHMKVERARALSEQHVSMMEFRKRQHSVTASAPDAVWVPEVDRWFLC